MRGYYNYRVPPGFFGAVIDGDCMIDLWIT